MEQEVLRIRETGAALDRISKVAEESAVLVEGHLAVVERSRSSRPTRWFGRCSHLRSLHLTLEGTHQTRESLRGISTCCERLQPLAAPGASNAVALGGRGLGRRHASAEAFPSPWRPAPVSDTYEFTRRPGCGAV